MKLFIRKYAFGVMVFTLPLSSRGQQERQDLPWVQTSKHYPQVENVRVFMGSNEDGLERIDGIYKKKVGEKLCVKVVQSDPVPFELSVTDTLGNVLQRREYTAQQEISEVLNICGLARGTYYLKCYGKHRHLQYIIWTKM